MLAYFCADAITLGTYTPDITIGLISYAVKPKAHPPYTLDDLRPITVSSTVGKIIERLILHALFPINSPHKTLICPEQFANKKHIGADMPPVILSTAMNLSRGAPLYFVFADVKAAYDSTWRNGVNHKLKRKHPSVQDVKQVRELYRTLKKKIKLGADMSEPFEQHVGVSQGSPTAGDLFTFYISDLPEELGKAGSGITLLGLLLWCIIFLDDIAIISISVPQVQKTLDCLFTYCRKWDLELSLPKLGVLCLNAPPAEWKFGPHKVQALTQEKYLSVTFQNDGKWDQHYADKKKKSESALHALLASGLLGGKHDSIATFSVARQALWPIIETGRVAAEYHAKPQKIYRKQVETFKLKTMRLCLNVSSTASTDGVLGELGMYPDMGSADRQHVQLLRRFVCAPRGSIPASFARQGLTRPNSGYFFSVGRKILSNLNLPLQTLTMPNAKENLDRAIHSNQESRWQQRITIQPHLQTAFDAGSPLTPQKYLALEAFKGKTLITKLRIDDLELKAASYNTKNQGLCPLCLEAAESRTHFILECKELSDIREVHTPMVEGLDEAFDLPQMILLKDTNSLTQPKLIERAHATGSFLAALWQKRQKTLGLPQRYFP